MAFVPPPHPAGLDEEELLKRCHVDRTKAGGPGGQRRNKVETAVEVTHKPTGVAATASERREQAVNLRVALKRLRLKLAVEARSERDLVAGPSDLWRSRVREGKIACNPDHRDYPTLLAEALDVLSLVRDDPKRASLILGVTPSQFVRFVKKSPEAFAAWNERRQKRGQRVMK